MTDHTDSLREAASDTASNRETTPGGFMPPSRRGPLYEDDEATLAGKIQAAPHAHEADDDDEDYEVGFFALVWDNWYYVVGGVAVLLVAVILLGRVFGGEGQSGSVPEGGGAAEGAPHAPEGGASLRAQDTGVVVQRPEIKDGSYYLQVGDIAWKGKIVNTETGQELTLEGATAAQFKDAVALTHGSITTGVFGRAEPGKPTIHATFQRTTIGEQEETQGTYEAIDGGDVILKGYYDDTRDGNTVTRVYSERAPGSTEWRRYAVRFEAPPGVPIPALIGWEPPEPASRSPAG